MARRKPVKLGHQSPQGWRQTNFNSIEISGDLKYCASHNFVFDGELEERKLHYAQPCYYTDARYVSGPHNFYKECMLFWQRFSPISLKACIRRTMRCRNIPKGTLVRFGTSWYHSDHRRMDTSFYFKVKKENRLDLDYQVSYPSYSENFITCERSRNIVDALRAAGFLVSVHHQNVSFILSMINTASAVTGKPKIDDSIEGEYAIAYGYGKRIGISSHDFPFMGYHDGKENILWDKYDEFDKWSRCNWIKKDAPLEEIINTLKTDNDEI